MWFAVGLVSLALVLAWQLRFRWRTPWRGDPRPGTLGEVRQRVLTQKNSTVGMELGCAVPAHFRFDLKPETWVDRFFKWIGLSVEHQFGSVKFDRLVYVASNDRHLVNRVADSPELRGAAVQVFQSSGLDCKVRRVVCAHGWLRVELRRLNLFSRKDDAARLERCAQAVLPHLRQLGQRLREAPPAPNEAPERDPYLLRSVVLLAISSALAIHGTLFLLRPALFDDAFLVDTWRIVELAILLGGTIVGLLVVANVLLLGGSARGHLVLLELLLVGSFGAVASSAAELRDANIEWDRSPAQRLEAPVTGKSVSRSRKGGTRYYLHVADWVDPAATRKIKVSSGFYARVSRGHSLVIEQHEGRFDARWARIRGARDPKAPAAG